MHKIELIIIIIIAMMMEACTFQVDTEPIKIELEITASLECKEESLIESLTLPECVAYEPADCCNIAWSTDCYISFCEDCIGISAPCYDQEED